jgi:ribonuclease P protein subunit POP4
LIDEKNLIFASFIGLKIKIINSSCQDFIGAEGIIINESKNTITIETTDKKEKQIPKIACKLEFTLDNGKKRIIDGKKIMFRPEERGKKI